jgi:hypothetical protein
MGIFRQLPFRALSCVKLLGGDRLSRKAWQVSIVATWTLFVVVYVWFFHDGPAHDEEYGKWLFVSLVGTAAPWIYCSTPVALIVLSLESRHRTRRTCITLMWAVIVICLAWVKLHRAFYSGPPPELIHFSPMGWMTSNVEEFAITWLFPALFVLAAVLWIEKIMVKRGLLA